MNTQSFQLSGCLCSIVFDNFHIRKGAQCHLTRIENGGIQAHAQAPLGIHSNEQRNVGHVLVPLCKFQLILRTTLKENDAPHSVFRNPIHHLLVIEIHVLGIAPCGNHEELTNFLVQSKCAKYRISPRC